MYIVHVLDGARIVVYRINNAHVLNRQKHSLYSIQCTMYLFLIGKKQPYIQYKGGVERLATGYPDLGCALFLNPIGHHPYSVELGEQISQHLLFLKMNNVQMAITALTVHVNEHTRTHTRAIAKKHRKILKIFKKIKISSACVLKAGEQKSL